MWAKFFVFSLSLVVAYGDVDCVCARKLGTAQTTGIGLGAVVEGPAGSNRLYVADIPGTIRVFERTAGSSTQLESATYFEHTQPFLDISSMVYENVNAGGEGFVGFAFGAGNTVFVNYIGADRQQVLARYTYSSFDTVDINSRTVILNIPRLDPSVCIGQDEANCGSGCVFREEACIASGWTGGQLLWDPNAENVLFVAVGDDAPSGAQDGSSLLGKILRINTDGSAAAGNPFLNDATIDDRVYALGFRQPWNCGFSRDNTLICTDAGHGPDMIKRVVPGARFGWPISEGTTCVAPGCESQLSSFTAPVLQYGKPGVTSPVSGVAPVGGKVYSGTMSPGLIGKYVWADLATGLFYAPENRIDLSMPLPVCEATKCGDGGETMQGIRFMGQTSMSELLVGTPNAIWTIYQYRAGVVVPQPEPTEAGDVEVNFYNNAKDEM